MDPYFLFGSTANELLAVMGLCCVVTACALAFGSVHLYRYYKTRARRSLALGLLLILGVPALAYLGLVLDANLIEWRVGPDLIQPNFFQNDAGK